MTWLELPAAASAAASGLLLRRCAVIWDETMRTGIGLAALAAGVALVYALMPGASGPKVLPPKAPPVEARDAADAGAPAQPIDKLKPVVRAPASLPAMPAPRVMDSIKQDLATGAGAAGERSAAGAVPSASHASGLSTVAAPIATKPTEPAKLAVTPGQSQILLPHATAPVPNTPATYMAQQLGAAGVPNSAGDELIPEPPKAKPPVARRSAPRQQVQQGPAGSGDRIGRQSVFRNENSL